MLTKNDLPRVPARSTENLEQRAQWKVLSRTTRERVLLRGYESEKGSGARLLRRRDEDLREAR
jgi:hypothetical protein